MGQGESIAPPEAAQIRDARLAAGLTTSEAAHLVHTYSRLWRMWESGKHRMPAAAWELFQLKVAQRAEADA